MMDEWDELAKRYGIKMPEVSSPTVNSGAQPSSAPSTDISHLLDRMRGATFGQESGGNYKVKPNARTNAMGGYQVLPENIPVWTQKHLKRRLTPEQFQNDPAAQDAVFNGEMGEYLKAARQKASDDDTAIRMAAAAWYGGKGAMHRYDDPKKFRPNEPSFREYTTSVLNRSKNGKANTPEIDFDSLSAKYLGGTVDFDSLSEKYLGGVSTPTDQPTPTTQPTPEAPSAFEAQLTVARDPKNMARSGVFFPNDGTNAALKYANGLDSNWALFPDKKHNGTHLINLAKAKKLKLRTPKEIQEFIDKNPNAFKTLGIAVEDVGNDTQGVAITAENNGVEHASAVVRSPETAVEQINAYQKQFPDATIRPTTTDEIVQNRIATLGGTENVPPSTEPPMTVAGELISDPRQAGKTRISQAEQEKTQAALQARFAELRKTNPSLTVDQFNKILSDEHKVKVEKSKQEWLAKNPALAKFAKEKNLDPFAQETVNEYNASRKKYSATKSTAKTQFDEASFNQANKFLREQGQPELSREEFIARQEGNSKVGISLDPNTFTVDGTKITDYEIEAPAQGGGTIRFPREVGKGRDANGTVAVYRSEKGMSEEDAYRAALLNAGSRYGITPEQVNAQIDKLKSAGKKFFQSGKHIAGNMIAVTWDDLANVGVDVNRERRMEQSQNTLVPAVDVGGPQLVTAPGGTRYAVANKDTELPTLGEFVDQILGDRDQQNNLTEQRKKELEYRVGETQEESEAAEFRANVLKSALANNFSLGESEVITGFGLTAASYLSWLGAGGADLTDKIDPFGVLSGSIVTNALFGRSRGDFLGKFGNKVQKLNELSTPDNSVYKIYREVGNVAGALPAYAAVGVAVGGNPVLTFAITDALVAKGKGGSLRDTIGAGAKGAVMGAMIGNLSRFGTMAADGLLGESLLKVVPKVKWEKSIDPSVRRAISRIWQADAIVQGGGSEAIAAKKVIERELAKSGLTLEQVLAAKPGAVTGAEATAAANEAAKKLTANTADGITTEIDRVAGRKIARGIIEYGVPIGLATGIGYGVSAIEGGSTQDNLKNALLFGAMQALGSIFHKKKGEKLTPDEVNKADGTVVRVPDEKGKPHDLILLKENNELTVTDVTGKVPPEAIQGAVLPKPPTPAPTDGETLISSTEIDAKDKADATNVKMDFEAPVETKVAQTDTSIKDNDQIKAQERELLKAELNNEKLIPDTIAAIKKEIQSLRDENGEIADIKTFRQLNDLLSNLESLVTVDPFGRPLKEIKRVPKSARTIVNNQREYRRGENDKDLSNTIDKILEVAGRITEAPKTKENIEVSSQPASLEANPLVQDQTVESTVVPKTKKTVTKPVTDEVVETTTEEVIEPPKKDIAKKFSNKPLEEVKAEGEVKYDGVDDFFVDENTEKSKVNEFKVEPFKGKEVDVVEQPDAVDAPSDGVEAQQLAEYKQQQEELRKTDDGIESFVQKNKDRSFSAPLQGELKGKSVILHPSTRGEGLWQASFLDKDGEPFRDTVFSSYKQAVDEIVRQYNADLSSANVHPSPTNDAQTNEPKSFVPQTANTTTRYNVGAQDTFKLDHKSGASVTGYLKNADMPNGPSLPTRGELFYAETPANEQRKGIATSLAKDALRLMQLNGATTVTMNGTTEAGRKLIQKLQTESWLGDPIQTSTTGKTEYPIQGGMKNTPSDSVEVGKGEAPAQLSTKEQAKALRDLGYTLPVQRTLSDVQKADILAKGVKKQDYVATQADIEATPSNRDADVKAAEKKANATVRATKAIAVPAKGTTVYSKGGVEGEVLKVDGDKVVVQWTNKDGEMAGDPVSVDVNNVFTKAPSTSPKTKSETQTDLPVTGETQTKGAVKVGDTVENLIGGWKGTIAKNADGDLVVKRGKEVWGDYSPANYVPVESDVKSSDNPLRSIFPNAHPDEIAAVEAAGVEVGNNFDPAEDSILRSINASVESNFPVASDKVDGRVVRKDVPNTSSISATFTDYAVLPDIREVPMSAFNGQYERTARTKSLAQEIDESGEISPLIVAIDAEGPYILEGAHRFDALGILGAKSFPAMVVIDQDTPLFKIRSSEDVDALYNVLPYIQNTGDLLEFANGGTITDGELELSPYDAEVTRRLLAEVQKGTDVPASEGAVYNASTLNKMAKVAEAKSAEMTEMGYPKSYTDNLDNLAKNLRTIASNAKHGILYTFDESLPEERFHLEDLSAGRTSKEAIEQMKQSPLWDASEKFNRDYGKLSDRDKASEIVAKLATGQEKAYGWDKIDNFEAERAKLFDTWIDGVIAQNNITNIEAFNKEFTRLGAVYAEAKTNKDRTNKEGVNGNTGVQGGTSEGTNENRGQSEEGDGVQDRAVQGEEGKVKFTPGGKEKESKAPKTLQKRGFPVKERIYTSTTNAERTEFANKQLDKGVDEAKKWAETQLDDENYNAGATGVVGINVLIQLGKEKRMDEFNKFADKLMPAYTDAGQMVQSLAIVSIFSPETAPVYLAKMAKKNGKTVTQEQLDKATDLAERMSESSQAMGVTEAAYEAEKQFNELLKNEIDELEKALDIARSEGEELAKKNKELRTQLAGKGRKIASLERKLEGSLPKTRLAGEVAKKVKEIDARKDDILARLAAKFGENPVLRMITGGDNALRSSNPPIDQDVKDWATWYLGNNIGKITVQQFKDALNTITNGAFSADELARIHADAVNELRVKHAPMDAEKRVATALRNSHYREADRLNEKPYDVFGQDVPKPARRFANAVVTHGIRNGFTPQEIWLTIARKAHPKVSDALKAFRAEFPDVTREEERQVIKRSQTLTNDVKAELDSATIQKKSEDRLSQEDIDLIKNERSALRNAQMKISSEANTFYNSLVKSKTQVIIETLVNARRANLLTAVKSHFVNIGGNVDFGISEELSRVPSTMIDTLAGVFTGERTTTFAPKGIIAGFKSLIKQDETLANAKWDAPEGRNSGIQAAYHVLKYGGSLEDLERLQHAESALSATFKGRIPKWIDNYVNATFRALGAEDALFKVYAFRRHIEEQARAIALTEHKTDKSVNVKERTAELVANPTNVMQVLADQYAHFMTFQNDNIISTKIAGIKRSIGYGGKAIIETIMPYDRTPTNIVLRALEYTPAGYAIGGAKFIIGKRRGISSQFRNDMTGAAITDVEQDFASLPDTEKRKLVEAMLNRVYSRSQQEQFAKTMGRASVGTGLFTLGFVLAAAGLMAGSMSPDDKDRKETSEFFRRMQLGVDNSSLAIPGVGRITLPKSPATVAMTAGATLYEQMVMSKKSPTLAAINASNEAFGDLASEQPLISSTTNLVRTFSKGEFGEFTGNLLSGFVPASAMVRSISEVGDAKARTGSGYKKGEKIVTFEDTMRQQQRGFKNSFLRGIPVARNYFVDESTAAVSDAERGGAMRRFIRQIDPFNFRSKKDKYVPPKAR